MRVHSIRPKLNIPKMIQNYRKIVLNITGTRPTPNPNRKLQQCWEVCASSNNIILLATDRHFFGPMGAACRIRLCQSKKYWVVREFYRSSNNLIQIFLESLIIIHIFKGAHGDNYFDRTNQLLYITLRGSEPIDVVTTPAIFIAVGFPSVSVDDFFQVNLVSNLAA